MPDLSVAAATLANDLAAGLHHLQLVQDAIDTIDSGQERAALCQEMQRGCGALSQAGAKARRAAVRAMRDDEGLTLDAIADAVGISRPRVSALVRSS